PSPRAPLHLPPFPTRRSSDLPVHVHGARVNALGGQRPYGPLQADIHLAFGKHLGDRKVVRGHELLENLVARRFLLALFASGFQTDRKSTRLNSSHGSISYAVF